MEGNGNNKFSFPFKHLWMPACVWLTPYRTSCLPVLFPALHLMLYLVWTANQQMKGNISKCVRYLASEGAALNYFHKLLDAKSTTQEKKTLSWHHYKYIIENICSMQSTGQERKLICSPSQMINAFPGVLGWMVLAGPSSHPSVRAWTLLADDQ